MLRSKLKAVQLVAICKHCYIKQYSLDSILDPLVHDLKQLVCVPIIYPSTRTYVCLHHFTCRKMDICSL